MWSYWHTIEFQELNTMTIKVYSICIIVGLTVGAMNPILAISTNINLYSELSPEIQAIIEGNQKTLDSIHTIQADIKKVGTYSLGDLGTRELINIDKIWFDGNHFRRDLLESKFTGNETEPVLLEEDSRGNKNYFRPLPVGRVEIKSIESNITYYPSGQQILIRHPETNDRQRILSNDLLEYQSVLGHTLKEKILQSAKKGYYFTTENETMNGDNFVLLTCDYVDVGMALKIWVVPSKGYCIKKMQNIYKDKVVDEYITTLREYSPGLWWFDTVQAMSWKQEEESPRRSLRLSVNSLIFNEPIGSNVFTIAGTDIPYGTKVKDEIFGIKYVYSMGFQLPEEDIDLVLDALEQSVEREVRRSVNKTGSSNEIKPALKPKPDDLEGKVVRIDGKPESLSSVKSDNPKDSQSMKYGLLLGFGIALIIIISCFILVRGKKHAKSN